MMNQSSSQTDRELERLAAYHGISVNAVRELMEAIKAGNGTMAQFNIPELGGPGQWMLGGMTMVGDMFDHSLKATVDGVCRDLSSSLGNGTIDTGNDAREKIVGSRQQQSGGQWWPSELGTPSSSGSQNRSRYAYFSAARRLVIDDGGQMKIYDTLDHRITGVSQQQSSKGSITFTSQHGSVDLDDLPLLKNPASAVGERITKGSAANRSAAEAASHSKPATPVTKTPTSVDGVSTSGSKTPATADGGQVRDAIGRAQSSEEILTTLEKLAKLKDAGVISDEEFQRKKGDLLSRL